MKRFGTLLLMLVACGRPTNVGHEGELPKETRSTGPDGHLSLRYLGVAGWEIDDGNHALLVDPYFSRPDAREGNPVLVPDTGAIARYAPLDADLILISHSHYDHAMDAPAIALHSHAAIAGTESTLNLARASGVPEASLILAAPKAKITRGPFEAQVFEGLHSLTGQKNEPIPRDVHVPLHANDYGEGGTLQYLVKVEGHTVFFVGSANFVEGAIMGQKPDIAVVAVGLREKIPEYTCRLMHALGNPKVVLANHFDAFWNPVGPKEMDIDDDAKKSLAAFADEVHACSPDTKVTVPEHFQKFPL
ncbi:MAG TPA: MBL fold metallo-hydrolase [Polyangiaceae bacterium]